MHNVQGKISGSVVYGFIGVYRRPGRCLRATVRVGVAGRRPVGRYRSCLRFYRPRLLLGRARAVTFRSDAGIPKQASAVMVKIIGGDFDGAELPAAQVLTPPWDMFDASELCDGEGVGEFEPGTRCRVISKDGRCKAYHVGDVFVYNGRMWKPVKEGE